MPTKSKHVQTSLEICLVLIVLTLICLLHRTAAHKMVVLNLFYLPVVLAAFFMGRYRAGVLALFSVITASTVSLIDVADFAGSASPIVIGLSITVWGAILGLTALFVGTLSDERSAKICELHEAYVGVVEVLARYLQSANPKLKDRSVRVSGLSEAVAKHMRLSEREIDDIRVASLLQDMENIEITARVIRKAMDEFGEEEAGKAQHTFHGTDLVHSLGSVLTGAFPLVLSRNKSELTDLEEQAIPLTDVPMGGRIIQTVRAYDTLVHGNLYETGISPREAISELKHDVAANHHPAVLHALASVTSEGSRLLTNIEDLTEEPANVYAVGI